MRALIKIAFRNVVRNRRRSLITLSAVFLAVGVMVAVRGLLNGLQAAIREGVVEGQTGAIQIHRKGFLKALQGTPLDLDLPADEAFLAKILAVDGVAAAAPRIPFGGMVNVKDQTVFTLFQAFDPVREPLVCPRRGDILEGGRPLDPKDPGGASLSAELMKRLGLSLGETAALLTGDRDGVLNAAEVKVTGRLGTTTLPLPDQKVLFLTLPAAQELLRMPGRATEIAIAVKRLDQAEAVAARLRAVVGPEYEVSSWHEVASFVDDLIATQDIMLQMVAYTFLFIALLGIANTMLMNVLERTREIGTMMAVGMRRRKILILFLVESALLGLSGGVAGAMAGGSFVLYYGGARGLAFPVMGSGRPLLIHLYVTPPYLLLVFGLATVGAALAALYPAWWASRLRPIEALSHA